MESRWKDPSRFGPLWVSPFLVGFGVFLLLPAGLSLWYSLTEYSVLAPPRWVGLENYRELWGDPLVWRALRNTAVFVAANVGLGTVLSLGLAVLLESRLAGSAVARAVVFVPTLVPVVAGTLAWMWLLNTKSGLVNRVLGMAGVEGPDWLGSPGWAMTSVVVISLWSVGGSVIIYGAAIRGVPASLYDAARIDGTGRWGRLRHVTLPMISPAVLLNVVMSIIWSMQAFAVPLITTRGGPDNATLTYALLVYNNAFTYSRMGYACALAWVQLLVTLVLVGVVLVLSRRLVYARGA